jgi:hypothetical protein
MDTLEVIDRYFGQEKSVSVLFLALGLAGIGAGLWFWFLVDLPALDGAIAPLLVLGTISGVVGGTIFFRTDSQVEGLKKTYQQDSGQFLAEEQARIRKVNRNWGIYKLVELVIIVAAVIFPFVFPGRGFWVACSVASIAMAATLLALDIVSERNGRWYEEQLRGLAAQDDS